MRTSPPPNEARRVRGAAIAAALPLLALAAALRVSTAHAVGRCSEDVCLELQLPPHVRQVSSSATLEFLVLLPAAAETPVNVKVVLRREGEQPPRCFARYVNIPRGSSWTRLMFRLDEKNPPVPPGVYSLGVARVSHAAGAESGPCETKADAPRFLNRRIRIGP